MVKSDDPDESVSGLGDECAGPNLPIPICILISSPNSPPQAEITFILALSAAAKPGGGDGRANLRAAALVAM